MGVLRAGVRRGVIALSCGAVMVACGSKGSSTSAALAEPCRAGSGVSGHATTKSYVLQLDVGPVETMYSPDQMASQHPTGGEVMLGGQMAPVGGGMGGMGGMGNMPGMGGTAGESDRHLEAHICSRATGAPVQNAQPTITLVDDSASNVSQDVPIAIMQGVGQDVSDYHYGNNVVMAPGRSYTVTVALNGERATFHLHMSNATSTTK